MNTLVILTYVRRYGLHETAKVLDISIDEVWDIINPLLYDEVRSA